MIDFAQLAQKNVEGLTDDQLKALGGLFDKAIAERVADIHRDYDRDIAAATGKTKPEGVKSYDWMKQEFATLKTAAETAAKEATEAATQKIAQLESQLEKAKSGGTATPAQVEQLQKDLQDAKDLATGLKEQHAKEIGEWESKYGELDTKYRRADVRQELNGIHYRQDIDEGLRELAVTTAVDYVLSLKAETDANGKTVYRDADGKLMTNPDNGLAPFTTSELLLSKLGGVIDKGRQQPGAGTKPGGAKVGQDGVILVNAKSQQEAMEQITGQLHAQGIAQSDERYQPAIDKAWEANKVSELPMQA